jgi:hypothetical protein
LAHAVHDDSEIDLNELRPAKADAKPPQQPQPSPTSTGEIDLNELRKIAPTKPAKPVQHKQRNNGAIVPDVTKAADSGHESMYVVLSGENLFQILMKQYGLSDPAAERLIPDVMQLNGISSPKGLKVGQRLRIPLPPKVGTQSASRKAPFIEPRQTPPPAATVASETHSFDQASTPKLVASPPVVDTISIVSAAPCKLALNLVEKMGLQARSPTAFQGVDTVSAENAGRKITVACGLSEAEQYTYERLLARNSSLLVVFDGDESAGCVVEEMSSSLGLEFHIRGADASKQRLTYIFAPFGVRTQELQLIIFPAQTPI